MMRIFLPLIVLFFGVNMIHYGAPSLSWINVAGCVLIGTMCGMFIARHNQGAN